MEYFSRLHVTTSSLVPWNRHRQTWVRQPRGLGRAPRHDLRVVSTRAATAAVRLRHVHVPGNLRPVPIPVTSSLERPSFRDCHVSSPTPLLWTASAALNRSITLCGPMVRTTSRVAARGRRPIGALAAPSAPSGVPRQDLRHTPLAPGTRGRARWAGHHHHFRYRHLWAGTSPLFLAALNDALTKFEQQHVPR